MHIFHHTLRVHVTARTEQERESHAVLLEAAITSVTGGLTRSNGIGYWAPTNERERVVILEVWFDEDQFDALFDKLVPALRFYVQAAKQHSLALVLNGEPMLFAADEVKSITRELISQLVHSR
jgi:hypothetical protein